MLNELSMSMAAGYCRKQLVVAEIALKEVKEKEGSSSGLLTEVEEKMEEHKLHPGSHDHMDRHRSESDSGDLSEGDVSEAYQEPRLPDDGCLIKHNSTLVIPNREPGIISEINSQNFDSKEVRVIK